jgi:uncharacterized damage-inducible protein DinB
MFTIVGIRKLHEWSHQSLDLLFAHVASVPSERLTKELVGFGIPTVWKQLVHILEVEEAWVGVLQDKSRPHFTDEDCHTQKTLVATKQRVQNATLAYLHHLSETQLNTALAKRPSNWVGELRSPAFILLHIVTHTFHHKGQVAAMLRILGYPTPDTDLQRA